ncbi:hypothetical protein KSS87_013467, partial [Heliosperma pusillum]
GRLGRLDFEESVGSSKVLQGQENLYFVSLPHGCDKVRNILDDEPGQAGHQSSSPTGFRRTNIGEFRASAYPMIYRGISESDRFPKVLQGQEIFPLRSLSGKPNFSPGGYFKPSLATSYFNLYEPRPDFYPLASEGARNMFFPYKSNLLPKHATFTSSSFEADILGVKIYNTDAQWLGGKTSANSSHKNLEGPKDGSADTSSPNCKLFGFHLERESSAPNMDIFSKRSCTKVHKQGSLVGRAVDLSRLKSYEELISELEQLFGMEGLLHYPAKGWRILYTDNENDMMVVGDDPWHEFCNVVSKIHIHTREEVEKMTVGMVTDDNHSGLEEAPGLIDASLGHPDSSPH